MSFRPSFDTVKKDGTTLVVTGQSAEMKDTELVARFVAVEQGETDKERIVVSGPAPNKGTEIDWEATLAGAADFEREEALAIGSETYFRKHPASYLTFTWSERITIS